MLLWALESVASWVLECGVVGTELYILGIEEALCSSIDDVSNPVGTLGLRSFARIMARVVLLSSIPLPS